MTEVYTVVETYDFRCGRCGHTWEQDYEVRRWQDPEGDEFTCYCVNGVPVDVPAHTPCPDCGGYRVRLLPYRRRGSVHWGEETIADTKERNAVGGGGNRWLGWIVLSGISHLPG
jgi:hypothetical protein